MAKSTLILLTLAAFSAAAGQLLFKVGARDNVNWSDFFNVPIFLGLFFYGAGTVLWIYALSFEKLVNVYAFTALTFVLVYLGGVFLLSERISLQAGIGICAVLGGLYLIVNYNS
jgi:drug/metabolite transporter (DMT)-like permease